VLPLLGWQADVFLHNKVCRGWENVAGDNKHPGHKASGDMQADGDEKDAENQFPAFPPGPFSFAQKSFNA
jgi:hypothetical protein